MLGSNKSQNKIVFDQSYDRERFVLHEVYLNPKNLSPDEILDEYQEIEFHAKITIKDDLKDLHLTFVLKNEIGDTLFTFSHSSVKSNEKLKLGLNKLTCIFPKGFLNVGSYNLDIYIIQNSKITIFNENDVLTFNVQEGERGLGAWMGKEPGFIKPKFEWIILN
jgi:lipopolysaccharide transport system ATP-binding protein